MLHDFQKWILWEPLCLTTMNWSIVMSSKIFFLVSLLMLCFSAYALANENTTKTESKTKEQSESVKKQNEDKIRDGESLAETVVTSNRVDENYFESNRSLSVINKKSLKEHSPRTTPEALMESPGVFIQETNYGGGSPIMRGLVGPQVLILYDGVRLNNSVFRTGPLQYLNLIDQFSIERVEAMRGAGSLLYGSDAMGGVIQLFSNNPADFRKIDGVGVHGTVIGRWSSADNGQAYHAHIKVGKGGFSFLGGISLKYPQNLTGGGDVGKQSYSGYQQYSPAGKLVYRFTDGFFSGWRASLGYHGSIMQNAGRTDKLYDKQQLSMYDNSSHLLYADLHMVFRPISTKADLQVSYQNFYELKDSFKMADDLTSRLNVTRDKTWVNTLGLDLHMITTLLDNRLKLNYGATWYNDWVDAERKDKLVYSDPWVNNDYQNYPDGSTYDTYGGFLMISGDPLKTESGHIIRLGAGYRIHGFAANAPAQGGMLEADYSQIGHTFHASAQYIYKDFFNLSATFSQGFRAPNLQESAMFGDTGSWYNIPNSDLEAEKSDTLEVLARVNFWRARLDISGYYTMLKDLLTRVDSDLDGITEIDGKQVVIHDNVNKGKIWGTEASLFFDLGYGLSLNGNVTYTWGEEVIDGEKNQPLSRIPPLYGQGTFRYENNSRKNWKGFVETYVRGAAHQSRISKRDESDTRIPEGGTPGWWTWNLRAGVHAYDWVRFVLAVENILDKKYKYHGSGIYSPGVNGLFTVEIAH